MKKIQIVLLSLLVLGAVLAVSGCTDSSTDGVYNMDDSAPDISPGKMVNVDVQTAKELIDSDSVFLMDVRTPEEFNEIHIYGAQPISLQELENPQFLAMVTEGLPRGKPILVYCQSGDMSIAASEILIDADFAVYIMEGGIEEWKNAGYETISLTGDGTTGVVTNPVNSVPVPTSGKMVNINAQTAKELIDGGTAFLMDVRTLDEFNDYHIDGAEFRPLQDLENPQLLESIVNNLPKDKPILVYCRSGRRSVSASDILIDADFAVYNMEGGIIEWEKAGYETVSLKKEGTI